MPLEIETVVIIAWIVCMLPCALALLDILLIELQAKKALKEQGND